MNIAVQDIKSAIMKQDWTKEELDHLISATKFAKQMLWCKTNFVRYGISAGPK